MVSGVSAAGAAADQRSIHLAILAASRTDSPWRPVSRLTASISAGCAAFTASRQRARTSTRAASPCLPSRAARRAPWQRFRPKRQVLFAPTYNQPFLCGGCEPPAARRRVVKTRGSRSVPLMMLQRLMWRGYLGRCIYMETFYIYVCELISVCVYFKGKFSRFAVPEHENPATWRKNHCT